MSQLKCSESVKKIVKYSRLLIEKGVNTLTSGNLSSVCYINESKFVILTPSGLNKYELTYNDLVFYNFYKKKFYGKNKPTSEYRMHLETYHLNDKVTAIAHAHNPITLALIDSQSDFVGKQNLVEKVFNETDLVESKYVVGKVCVSEYIEPGTKELAEKVASLSKTCDNIILSNHGVVSFGESIDRAIERIIGLEYVSLYYFNKINFVKIL